MDQQTQAEAFSEQRTQLMRIMERYAGRNMKRFLTLDQQAYEEGALPAKTKELLGLVASAVLRCDDCIMYHLLNCREKGVSSAELEEALNVALIVGGSIILPHIRRALAAWDELEQGAVWNSLEQPVLTGFSPHRVGSSRRQTCAPDSTVVTAPQ